MKSEIKKILDAAFAEDIGAGDVTTQSVISKDAVGVYAFVAREEMVFCGAEIISQAFIAPVKVFVKDGQKIKSGKKIAEVRGCLHEILAKERTVLNLIQHLSGVATETAKYVAAVKGTKAKILDTRKTIPGLRVLQKYAVKCGGGKNHRMGLYDMVMIKDNHIQAAGGISAAVKKACAAKLKIEVECDTLEQIREAVAAKPDVILADNMTLADLRQAVKLAKGKCKIEASGNVNLKIVRKIAETGVDFISTSKITMGARAVDIGLDEV